MKHMQPSKFWQCITLGPLSPENIEESLDTFKQSPVNYSITAYDPASCGMMYLQALIHSMASNMTADLFGKLKLIQNRDVGSPITINYHGEDICLDYITAVNELAYLERFVDLNNIDILEIGAGYGRTCHTLLSNCNVKTYTIADIDSTLSLSRWYLKEVLSDALYKKVIFCPIEKEALNKDFDLCLCVDVFSELDKGQANEYIKYVDKHCSYFYLKTPLRQYDIAFGCKDATIDINLNDEFEKIDMVDEGKIKSQVPIFLKVYRPGNDWVCLDHSNVKPFMCYWQAIWKK